MSMFRSALRIWIVVFLWIAGSHGQTTTGTISGTVADSTGAVLPEASVAILNEDTGISRTVQADAAGRYTAPALPLGNYRITASLEGFQTEVRRGIVLTVGRRAVVDFQLTVGAITQTVEVTGEAPLVETTKGGLGQLVDSATINELPLNGRDLAQLITLQTGAVEYTAADPEGGKLLVVGGGRPTSNVFFIDGIAIESFNQKTPTGTSGQFLGAEAVREFRVETNAYSAEFGRGTGGIFNIATKSGTNTLHGSVFEFLRNDNLDAAKWEDNKFGLGKPEFKRNQFGFSLGGPIIQDSTFFFGTYEALRERLGQTQNSQTFSGTLRQGFLSYPVTPTTPRANIRPEVLPYLSNTQIWPLPNGEIHPDGTGDYNFAYSQPTDEKLFQVRLDRKLSDNDSLFGRYTFLDSSTLATGAFPHVSTLATQRNQYSTLEWSRILSPSFLNTFRYGFTRTYPDEVQDSGEVDPSLLFNPDTGKMGTLSVPGVNGGGGTAGDTSSIVLNAFQLGNDANYTWGRQTMKFGLNWSHIQFNGFFNLQNNIQYSFGSIADFFNANANRYRAGFGDPYRSLDWDLIGLYIQDDIRVTPRLTWNVGLRYEFSTVPTERYGRVSNLRGDLNFILNSTLANVTLGNPFIENPSLKNLAPRVGFAWDMFGNGRTALRGGFGMFHQQFDQVWMRIAAFRAPPFIVQINSTRNIIFPNMYSLCKNQDPFAPTDTRCAAGALPSPNFNAYKFKTPYAMQYNLNVESEVAPNTVVTLGYAGSRGVRLPAVADVNAHPAQTINGRLVFPTSLTGRPNRNWDQIRYRTPWANSWYNSAQLSVTRKYAQGLQAGGSYTFSRTIDEISGSATASDTEAGPSQVPNYHHKEISKGLSSFDARHVFTVNFAYELPVGPGKTLGSGLTGAGKWLLGGWQLGGIVTMSTGFPASVSISNRFASLGHNAEVPDLAPGASNNPIRPGNPDQYFDPTAFLFPPARTLGNLGRNTLIMPGRATVDFSLTKKMDLTEAANLQFRLEAFNLFNRPNFGTPSRNVFDNQANPDPTAGRITSTRGTARQIQLGLKLTF